MVVLVPKENLIEVLSAKCINDTEMRLDDGRTITNQQRKKAYATIRDISDYTGYSPEEQKEVLKFRHIINTGCRDFSLSDCSIDTAREFINTILDYALCEGIPLADFGVNRTDDIGKYLYYCIKHKKCAVCGRDGEIHHVDTIGMGQDRNRYDDSGNRKICLCRIHHTEAHTVGMIVFEKKYKVYGIVLLTDTVDIKKLYNACEKQVSEDSQGK